MKCFMVVLFVTAVAALPAEASTYRIGSSKVVNANETLQLGVHLYPSLSAWCSDDAVFALVTNPNVPDAQRQAAEKQHAATIRALPELKRNAKVYAEKIVRVTCSGDPDASPMAFVRVLDGKTPAQPAGYRPKRFRNHSATRLKSPSSPATYARKRAAPAPSMTR